MNSKLFVASILVAGTMLFWLFIWPGEEVTSIIVRSGTALFGVINMMLSFTWYEGKRVIKRMVLVIGVMFILATVLNQLFDWGMAKYPGATITIMIVFALSVLVIIKATTPKNLNNRKIAW